jgi:hypothetical protein
MRRIAFGLLTLLVLAAPAAAQRGKDQGHEPTEEEIMKKQDKESVDKQYKEVLRRTDQKATAPVKVDPWANMRGDAGAKR